MRITGSPWMSGACFCQTVLQICRRWEFVETNPKRGRVWLIAAVMLAVVLIGVIGWRTRLSPDEQLEQEAISAMKKLVMFQAKKFWRSPGLVKDWIRGKATETQYSAIYDHAETNLLRTGYLVKQRIRFEHGTHSWKAFGDAQDTRLGDGMWSCKFLTDASTIEVIARSNAIPIWEALARWHLHAKQRMQWSRGIANRSQRHLFYS